VKGRQAQSATLIRQRRLTSWSLAAGLGLVLLITLPAIYYQPDASYTDLGRHFCYEEGRLARHVYVAFFLGLALVPTLSYALFVVAKPTDRRRVRRYVLGFPIALISATAFTAASIGVLAMAPSGCI